MNDLPPTFYERIMTTACFVLIATILFAVFAVVVIAGSLLSYFVIFGGGS